MATASPADDIERTLGMTPAGPWRRLVRWFAAIIVVLAIVVAAMRMGAGAGADTGAQYQTEPVTKGTFIQTVLTVDNSERLLQPGMTATAEITVTEVPDAVLVPNAALRFTPPAAQAPAQGGGGIPLLPRPPGLQRRPPADDGQPRVWRLTADNRIESVEIAVGPTDGKVTVLRDGDLTPGTPLIVDLMARN